jgi:hypothetical protein
LKAIVKILILIGLLIKVYYIISWLARKIALK